MRYRRTKRDANHKAISDALKAAGCSVVDLAAVGDGVSDLLVAYCKPGPQPYGETLLMEVKNPLTKRGQQGTGKTTGQKQAAFRARWLGRIEVVYSIEEALSQVNRA
jgi:hypothetical protein